MELTGDPGLICVAGDWHGNVAWARAKVRHAAELLGDEEQKIIVHLGDFGFWDDIAGRHYLGALSSLCTKLGIRILVVPGNHEDWEYLDAMRESHWPPGTPTEARPGISFFPRGYRWQWHGRTWLAVSGAVSVDKADRMRREEMTGIREWFPEEEVTREQAEAIIAAGHADVVVAHDTPSCVQMTFPPRLPSWDWADIARSERHRELLDEIRRGVTPAWWLGGHYHHSAVRYVATSEGEMISVILDCDGTWGQPGKVNMIRLDARAMTWA
jgi:Calcineurin-like phosphoesterase